MAPIFALAMAISALILVYYFICFSTHKNIYRRCTCKENIISIRNLSEAREILKESSLHSRARPNQRLVRVFSISNAFTTTNQAFYQSFLKAATSLLKTSNDSASTLPKEVLPILNDEIAPSISEDGITPLSPLIQVFCFRLVLLKFFPSKHMRPMQIPIIHITQLINSLWISSKCSCFVHPSQIPMQKSLHHELDSLSLSTSSENENPLNILLPAYETLWRIVLRCFLEISFCHSSDVAAEWKDVLSQFLKNMTAEQFGKRIGKFSARDIVFEALRLYPPTKRIYRQDKDNGSVFAVDVEFIQRAEEIWGTDGNDFRPERWFELESKGNVAYKEAWMPFGKGKFLCPASKMAPMMVGMLVGCLIDAFGSDHWVLEGEGVKDVISRGMPLDNGREAFECLSLRRVIDEKFDV
ncbi:similar to cytochrome P450 [Botrytis cinerea T4]|uniref:Similar to cytochrome P450 n=1 Tax=Botryotinia fuckeliana (strain T4) TaxID=999810 RepID=G2YMT7_BOTF4|nr:similar to cytochrome P450 [Botrytis cinerea T4]